MIYEQNRVLFTTDGKTLFRVGSYLLFADAWSLISDSNPDFFF